MSSMKIAMLGWYPSSPDRIPGGPVQNTFIQVQTLRERDDVEVCVVSRSKDVRGDSVVDLAGVTVRLVGEPRWRMVPRMYGMIPRIARVLSDIDCDIAVSHHCTETLAATEAGLPVVHMVHGILKDEAPHSRGIEKLKFRLQVRAEEAAIRRATEVLCISNYGGRYCEQIRGGPVKIISYPIVEDMFFEHPPYTGGKSILFAGTINYSKNAIALVKAMPRVLAGHPDASLRLCGRVDDKKSLAAVNHLADELGVGGKVEYLGLISRLEILECLSDSVCLALPSRQENMPNVIAQAMASSRAVVAAPVGGVPEMVDEGVTGYLVQPDDIKSLADRIIALMDDPLLARRMGEAGRERALRRHGRHAHVEQLLEICRETVAVRNCEP